VIARSKLILRLMTDLIALRAFAFRHRRATAAEILVLRRQIALYKEPGIKPARPQAVELRLEVRLFDAQSVQPHERSSPSRNAKRRSLGP
jgi:hypothetical protein